ncbi:hypothetical protein V6N13_107352 [Hibiscus sabdariffa]
MLYGYFKIIRGRLADAISWYLRDLYKRTCVMRLTLIPREINMVADNLAKLASIGNFEEVYYPVPPPSIQPLTIVDTDG